jgi:hypothetical protein
LDATLSHAPKLQEAAQLVPFQAYPLLHWQVLLLQFAMPDGQTPSPLQVPHSPGVFQLPVEVLHVTVLV